MSFVAPQPGIDDARSDIVASDQPLTADPSLRLGDIAVAAVFLVAIVVEIWFVVDLDWARWQQVAATATSALIVGPLAFRSNWPLPAFVVNAAATLAMVAIGYDSDVYQWSNLLLLFSVAVVLANWRSVAALMLSWIGVIYFIATFEDADVGTGTLVLGLWFVVWLLGRIHGARQREHALRTDRDLAAALAETKQATLELEEQRTEMARELHDLIGHTVNVMVVHAAAGRRAIADSPETAVQAFETIESTGRSALDELDRVLGILRDKPDTPLAPLPGIPALPSLVADMKKAGLKVNLITTGTVDNVPGGIGLTIYRVVQEALTNTLKHAAATHATVEVSADSHHVISTVIDNGRGQTAELSPKRRGLAGIAERVQLHGGTAEFGNAADGGFRVTCAIPLATNGAPHE